MTKVFLLFLICVAAPRGVHMESDGRRVSPSSSLSATRVTYREKDNVSLQCVVEGGNPPPKVYWFMNSKNLTNSSIVKSEYLEDDRLYITRSSLHIDNVS